jgi:Bacterial regulatory proteins, tetR family
MLSTVLNSAWVKPQQERATRRLAKFLDTAAELFAEIGYEATTMTAIAERRRSRDSTACQLSRRGHWSRAAGKFNAERGSIVWIVLSP